MKNKRITAAFIAAVMTMAVLALPAMADRSVGMYFNDPYGWITTTEEGDPSGDHVTVMRPSDSTNEVIINDIFAWSGITDIRQRSDSDWEAYLLSSGRFSDARMAANWEGWHPSKGSASIVTETSRSVHETVNGYDYFRYDRSGGVYMGGEQVGAFDTITFMYAQDGYVYVMYYNAWNYESGHISDFMSAMNEIYYAYNTDTQPSVPDGISIYVNGYRVIPDSDPFIMSDRTMVPIRAVAEALGYRVDWDALNQIVLINGSDRGLKMMIGSSAIVRYIYGSQGEIAAYDTVAADVPAMISGGRTFLPLRAVGEALGASVDWDGTTRSVYISK